MYAEHHQCKNDGLKMIAEGGAMNMYSGFDLFIAFLIALLSTLLLTYPVKKLAIRWKVLDFPNYRKIHDKVTPRLGGLAIFLGAFLGALRSEERRVGKE